LIGGQGRGERPEAESLNYDKEDNLLSFDFGRRLAEEMAQDRQRKVDAIFAYILDPSCDVDLLFNCLPVD
jgi:hypothetical protein